VPLRAMNRARYAITVAWLGRPIRGAVMSPPFAGRR
jgi:hypothetical protein